MVGGRHSLSLCKQMHNRACHAHLLKVLWGWWHAKVLPLSKIHQKVYM